MKRRHLLSALATTATAGWGLPAHAEGGKVVFGYTAVTDFTSAFVAAEEGFFKKRGLDVELKFIPIDLVHRQRVGFGLGRLARRQADLRAARAGAHRWAHRGAHRRTRAAALQRPLGREKYT